MQNNPDTILSPIDTILYTQTHTYNKVSQIMSDEVKTPRNKLFFQHQNLETLPTNNVLKSNSPNIEYNISTDMEIN